MLPDHFGLLAYATRRMKNVVENLVIDRKKIESKVESNEKIYSSYVLHQLIQMNPVTKREDIYEAVQGTFFKSTTKEELRSHLAEDMDNLKLKHDAVTWIDFENMRSHYKLQFKKILARG